MHESACSIREEKKTSRSVPLPRKKYRSHWHEQINDKQLFFSKIITSIYKDCDYLNNKLLFRSDLSFLFNNSKVFAMNSFYSRLSSSSAKIFFQVQVRVRQIDQVLLSSSSQPRL